MTNNEIGPRFNLPAEVITVTPRGPEWPTFSYRQQENNGNGQEVLSMLIDDAAVGNLELTMSPALAQFVVATLAAMLTDIDELRRKWADDHA